VAGGLDVAPHRHDVCEPSPGGADSEAVGERLRHPQPCLGELEGPGRIAGPQRPPGLKAEQGRHHAAVDSKVAPHILVDQLLGLAVPVAQVEDDRFQGACPAEHEPVAAPLCGAMGLLAEVPGRVEVGVEGADRREVETQRPQALVAGLGRDLERACRRVELHVERGGGVGHQRHPGQQVRLERRSILGRQVDRSTEVPQPLAAAPVEVPEPGHRRGETPGGDAVSGREPPFEGGLQVAVLVEQRLAPRVRVTLTVRGGRLGEGDGPGQVPVAELACFAGFGEPSGRVRSDRLQQAVANRPAVVVGHDERLVHQPGEGREDLVAPDGPPGTERLGGSQAEAAGEHGEPAEHGLVGLVEERMAPVDRRGERLVPAVGPAGPSHEQLEPIVQGGIDLLGAEGAEPGGSQLDRERDAVEPRHDGPHCGATRGIELEQGSHEAGSIDEQGDGIVVAQGPDPGHDLAEEAERLAAGDQHRDARATEQDRLDRRRRGRDQVFRIVHAQQRPAIADVVDRRGERATDRLDEHARRRGDGFGDPGVVDQVGELDPPHAAVEPVRLSGGNLQRQPGLAGAARPGQGHEPRLLERGGELGDVVVAAHERGQPHRETGRDHRLWRHHRPRAPAGVDRPVMRASLPARSTAAPCGQARPSYPPGRCFGRPPVRASPAGTAER
jgi:hypothetical protein